MQDYENLRLKIKDVRRIEGFTALSDEEIRPILAFLCGLAKIETKIIINKKLN